MKYFGAIITLMLLLSAVASVSCRTVSRKQHTVVRTYTLPDDHPTDINGVTQSVRDLLSSSGSEWKDDRDLLTLVEKTLVIRSTPENHARITRFLPGIAAKEADPKPVPKPMTP